MNMLMNLQVLFHYVCWVGLLLFGMLLAGCERPNFSSPPAEDTQSVIAAAAAHTADGGSRTEKNSLSSH